MSVSIENYVSLSEQIREAKSQIIDRLVALHEDLCNLAQLERNLESERQKGVKYIKGLAHNAPELVEHLDSHNTQVNLPAQKVWEHVDSALTAIYNLNQPGVSPAVDELPDVVRRSNRIEDFTKGI